MTVALRALAEFVRIREQEMRQVRLRLIQALGSNQLVEDQQHAALVQLQGEEPYLRTVRSILDDEHLSDESKTMFLLQEADMHTQHEPQPHDLVGDYRYYAWQQIRQMLPVFATR